VDAGRIGCQLLTGDGWRFLRGPYDVGFAFLAPRLRAAFEDAAAHRPLPRNAAVAGLNAALAHHTATTATAAGPAGPAGLAGQGLLPALRAAVEECPGTELIAPGRVQSAILAFRHRDLPAALVRRRLAARGVVVWKTVAQETPLHLPRSGATTALRASLGPDTTPQDIARFGRALREVVREETAGAQRPRPARTLPPAPTPVLASAPAPVPPAGPRPRPSARRHLTLCPTP
jgi:selenocysteine lyase/cysteine desulfurase